MPPPPVTPSPHRFMQSQARRSSPTKKDSKPPSTISAPPPLNAPPRNPPAPSQFASTPKFSFAKPKPKSIAKPPTPSTPKPQVLQALRTTGRRIEDVEDSADNGDHHEDDDEMLDNGQTQHVAHSPPDSLSLPFSPKRRRLDPAAVNSPTTPPKPLPRFKAPPPPPSSTPHPINPTSRPTFLRPDNASSSNAGGAPIEPLPEVFSPHRRGGSKFLPGGLAATVQAWVLEAGHAAAHARRSYAPVVNFPSTASSSRGSTSTEDGFAIVFRVTSIKGQGPYIVKGETRGTASEGRRDVGVLLVGKWTEGMEVGKVVGVKPPVWEVKGPGNNNAQSDEQEKWLVGVDWKIL